MDGRDWWVGGWVDGKYLIKEIRRGEICVCVCVRRGGGLAKRPVCVCVITVTSAQKRTKMTLSYIRSSPTCAATAFNFFFWSAGRHPYAHNSRHRLRTGNPTAKAGMAGRMQIRLPPSVQIRTVLSNVLSKKGRSILLPTVLARQGLACFPVQRSVLSLRGSAANKPCGCPWRLPP